MSGQLPAQVWPVLREGIIDARAAVYGQHVLLGTPNLSHLVARLHITVYKPTSS